MSKIDFLSEKDSFCEKIKGKQHKIGNPLCKITVLVSYFTEELFVIKCSDRCHFKTLKVCNCPLELIFTKYIPPGMSANAIRSASVTVSTNWPFTL